MNLQDKKQLLINLISLEKEPISLSNLLNKSNENFSVRSARRWLSELIQEGIILKIGEKKGAKYQILKKAKNDISGFFSEESKQILKPLGFDEIRVRFRQERKSVIRDIILQQLYGDELNKFISQAINIVPEKDRESFREDILEDLKEMDSARIAGLGVTLEELNSWKKLHS